MHNSHSRSMQLAMVVVGCVLSVSCSFQGQIARSASEKVTGSPGLKNAHVGISIFEPMSGKFWFDYQGDKYFIPASNTKIPTCYSAMKYLGDSLTGILYDTSDGKLRVIGTGDPSFLHPDFKVHPVYDFIKNSTFRNIELYETFFSPDKQENSGSFKPYGRGWPWNDYNESYMPERNFFPMYGNVARFSLREGKLQVIPSYFQNKVNLPGNDSLVSFSIERMQGSNYFFVSQGSNKYQEIPIRQGFYENVISLEDSLLTDTLHRKIDYVKAIFGSRGHLTRIHSQPTDSLLKIMMHRSDNFFAEQSILMVSNEFFSAMSDEKVIDTLLKTDFKDLPQKPRWVDGSGLSRYNLFSPRDLIAILGKIKSEFGMERVKSIFPTGGEGTISSYYKADSGYIYAKTGTLSGVVALSGFLTTKKGKDLIFSILVNNHQVSPTEIRRAIEKFLQGIRNRY